MISRLLLACLLGTGGELPTMPFALALATSSTVSCGDKYNVIKNLTFGSSRSNFSLYAKAISVVVTGGVKFGFESASGT